MKRFTAILTAAVVAAAAFIPYTADEAYAEAGPAIEAEAAILIDVKSGEVLYNKNADVLMEPASTTKMITCILALENLELDQVVTIDDETPFTEGSRIYLEAGEQMTVEDLLYALMLESANDAAVALAKAVSGDIESFAKLMNEKAAEIGAKNTQFLNPNGLHEDGHLVSAYDLAMIAKYGMQNEMFRKLVSTYKYEMSPTNIRPERAETPMYTTNRLLYDTKTQVYVNGVKRATKYEGATGIKTGYTSHAGGCLVAGAERNGTELISVVLKSSDLGRFADSIALLDYGFANYHSALGIEKGADLGTVDVKRGAKSRVAVTTAEASYVTLPVEAASSMLKTKLVLDKDVKAPIKKGQKIGVVEIYEGDTLRDTVDAVAAESVGKGTVLSVIGIGNTAAYIIFTILGIIALLGGALITARIVIRRKQEARRRELREKRALEIARQREARRNDHETREWHF